MSLYETVLGFTKERNEVFCGSEFINRPYPSFIPPKNNKGYRLGCTAGNASIAKRRLKTVFEVVLKSRIRKLRSKNFALSSFTHK